MAKKTQFDEDKFTKFKSFEKEFNVHNYTTTSNNDTKIFITMPFPYSNGELHLGHAYTLSKADFRAHFEKLNGKNVLFPFGFHGTGMPIVACANKLKEELQKEYQIDKLPSNSQIKILLSQNIKLEDIPKFVDPNYWIQYFPEKTKQILKEFCTHIDFSRSFVTTELNKYFDSFVKWQFSVLHDKGYLAFGKHPMIYSIKDNQVCSGHDRQLGEDVNPVQLYCYFVDAHEQYPNAKIIVTSLTKATLANNIVYYNPNDKYYLLIYNDQPLIVKKEAYLNIEQQYDVKYVTNIILTPNSKLKQSQISFPGSGFSGTFDETLSDPDFTFYVPESLVISRTGDNCVVKLFDQWYIDYSKTREKTLNYIKTKLKTDEESRKKLIVGAEWLEKWPCTRSIGLGTKFLDTDYLIDSLSDSTIYMMFYTIAHKIETIPIEFVTNDLWNAIFKNTFIPELLPLEYIQTVVELQTEFNYWYPVDHRISGKDLTTNHLVMAIHNHIMIFDDDLLCPKEYNINGHIMLNNEKMSKSTGNFMTLSEAINTYSVDAIRFVLASSGSYCDDANFVTRKLIESSNKLYTEYEWILSQFNDFNDTHNNIDINDQILDNETAENFNAATKYYKQCDFANVIVCVYKMITSRKKYMLRTTPKSYTIRLYINRLLLILAPICPSLVNKLWKTMKEKKLIAVTKWLPELYTNSQILFDDYMNEKIIDRIGSKLSKVAKSNNYNVTIKYVENFDENELNIIECIRKINIFSKQVLQDLKINVQDFSKYMGFIKDLEILYTRFGQSIYNIITKPINFNKDLVNMFPNLEITLLKIERTPKCNKLNPSVSNLFIC